MRIAMIYHPLQSWLGYPGYLERAFRKLCDVTHFLPGEEQPGFDHYIYVDDGPSAYMQPMRRPATFLGMDMVVKSFWYLQPVETYYQRMLNFDHGTATSTASVRYCQERGYPAIFSGFGFDPEYHRPLDFTKDRDWVACWHNCEGRVAATEAMYKAFPGGQWVWAGGDLYAAYLSRGRCAVNWLRGDIINMRVFEVMACRVPLVTTRHEDMQAYGLIEGEHYIGYDHEDIDGLLSGIAWCNGNPVAADQMAIRAWRYVCDNHTYKHRAEELLEWLQL